MSGGPLLTYPDAIYGALVLLTVALMVTWWAERRERR